MKKVIASVLAILLVLGMVAGAVLPASAATVAGDVNTDGKINLLDVMITLRLLAGQEYGGLHSASAMFVNGDGVADLSDAVTLLRKSAGWDVALTPFPEKGELGITQGGVYYVQNSTVKLISQNLRTAGDLETITRDECLAALTKKYAPDIIAMQEYRADWTTVIPGENFTVSCYVDRDGKVTDAENAYNYVISTDETSVLGEGYQGYVQTRFDYENLLPYGTTNRKLAYQNYLAALEADGTADPLDYAPQPDERLAIFWNADVLEPVTDEEGNPVLGRFFLSDQGDYRPDSYAENGGIGYTGTDVNGDGVITPDEDADIGFYNNENRLCNWVRLRVKATGEELYVFNAHGPNGEEPERHILAMEILRDQMAAIAEEGVAVILTGDLNINYAAADTAAARAVLNKDHRDAAVEMGMAHLGTMRGTLRSDGTTFKGILLGENGAWEMPTRIDYFYVKNNRNALCLNYKVLLDTFTYDVATGKATYAGEFDPWEAACQNEDYSITNEQIGTVRSYVSDHFGIYGEFVIA